MWLSNFVQLAFMAATFSTQVIAGDKTVPRPSDLGIQISEGKYPGKIFAESEDGFYGKYYVTDGLESIQIEKMTNPSNNFKSHEAVVSIWEDQSRLTLKNLKYIVYYNVEGTDSEKIDKAIRLYGHDPMVEDSIYGINVLRDSPADIEAWNHLITTSFAQDGQRICAEYKEMSNRYIKRFRIGSDADSARWASVDFGTNKN